MEYLDLRTPKLRSNAYPMTPLNRPDSTLFPTIMNSTKNSILTRLDLILFLVLFLFLVGSLLRRDEQQPGEGV